MAYPFYIHNEQQQLTNCTLCSNVPTRSEMNSLFLRTMQKREKKRRAKDEAKRKEMKKNRDAKNQNYVCGVECQCVLSCILHTYSIFSVHTTDICTPMLSIHPNVQLAIFMWNIKLISNLLSATYFFPCCCVAERFFLSFNHLVVCWNCVLYPYWAIFKKIKT